MAKKYLKNENGIVRAVTSDNLGLEKPLANENYDIEVHNRNMDKIDSAVQSNASLASEALAKANEAFQNGVNIKKNIVEAINSKVTIDDISTSDTWDKVISSINDIKEGRGNAVVANVLSGKTFTNDTGQMLTGTMVNRGGAVTVTPTTSNQTKSAGYYSGAITIKGDANLVASNILSGKSIFGVSGSVTVSSLGGKKWASGTGTSSSSQVLFKSVGATSTTNMYYYDISLSFTPSVILLFHESSTTEFMSVYNVWGKNWSAKNIKWTGYNGGSQSTATRNLATVTPSANTYRIPLSYTSQSVRWYAYE